MSPYSKEQIAALERERQLRQDWVQADKTPSIQSPWRHDIRETADSRDWRVVVWSWVAVAALSGIMFMLGWLARAAL